MMHWGLAAGAMLWIVPLTVLFWGGAAFLVVLLIRALGTGPRGDDEAMRILRRRLAAGEITQEEFEKTRRALQG